MSDLPDVITAWISPRNEEPKRFWTCGVVRANNAAEYIREDLINTTGFDDAPQWRTMHSAPKGGAEYLIYQPVHKQGRSSLPARVVVSGHGGSIRQATHWMPIPKPPTE